MPAVQTKLIKVLQLERQQGCANSAVIGGLDGFLEHWRAEAAGVLAADVVDRVTAGLAGYDHLSVAERAHRVEELLKVLGRTNHGGPQSNHASSSAAASGVPSPGGLQAETRVARPQIESRPGPQDSGRQLSRGSAAGLKVPVVALRGVGRRTADALARLNLRSVEDLLCHGPSRYEDFRSLRTVSQLRPGDRTTVVGTVWDVKSRPGRNVQHVLSVLLNDTTGTLVCVFFNQPYLEREFSVGRRIVVSGEVEVWAGRLTMKAPEWEPLDQELVHTARLVPVYPLTAGIGQRWLRSRIRSAVEEYLPRLRDPLPEAFRLAWSLPTLTQAIRDLHFPDSEEAAQRARERLAFDELLSLQLIACQRRATRRSLLGCDVSRGRELCEAFVRQLPFAMTAAQRRALDEITADLASTAPMARLLQGDVGSGKTVVAVAAALMAVGAGCQAAIMAPTELLAEQHCQTLSRLLPSHGFAVYDPREPAAAASARWRFARLTGGMRPREKEGVAAALAEGLIDLVVGTHALIQPDVVMPRLALAVIDEQHRFGVLQRAALPERVAGAEGGRRGMPHVLIMTATPIPRTLAMVLNADLDHSVIDELPPGRRPVRTHWLASRDRERAYHFIRQRVRQGQQAYVVVPLIEDSESVAAPAALAAYERFRDEIFPDLRVGLVHGRMRPSEKEAAMAAFRLGQTDVLVATSVIEVGVDVANATVMLVEGADRFGLAQLHQLRGRVGRGSQDSACLLLADDPGPGATARFEALVQTANGLELAELDLKQRGPGDYFGVQQSGVVERFRFAREASVELLQRAHRAARQLVDLDPELRSEDLAALRARVADLRQALERG